MSGVTQTGFDGPTATVLSRMAVFAGPFSRSDAIAMGLGGDTTSAGRVASVAIRRLLGDGIVVAAGPGMYRLDYEARRVAVARLSSSAEYASFRARHLQIFLQMARQADREWRGRHQSAWLARIDASFEDFVAAVDWAGQHDPEACLTIASALWFYWLLRGQVSTGREWLERALTASKRDTRARARALNEAGWLAYASGEMQTGRPLLEQSLSLARSLADEQLTAYALTRLGVMQASTPEVSQPLMREGLAIARSAGDRVGTYFALHELAQLAFAQGDYAEARRLHESALVLKRQQGDKWHIGFSVYWLALLDQRDGHLRRAERYVREGVRVRSELGDLRGAAMCVEVLAWLEVDLGRPTGAVELFGAADAIRSSIAAAIPPPQRAEHDEVERRLIKEFGKSDYQRRLKRATQVPPEDAIALALTKKPGGEA